MAFSNSIPDNLWLAVCGYMVTESPQDLLTTDPRFRGLSFSNDDVVAWLMIKPTSIINKLWGDLIHTDAMSTDNRHSSVVLAHLDRMFAWLIHPDVRYVHGLLPITFAFCEAHDNRARWTTRRLAGIVPLAMCAHDEEIFAQMFDLGEKFQLIIMTSSEEVDKTNAVTCWVTPPPVNQLSVPRDCVLLLRAHGANAPDPASPLFSAPPMVLVLDDPSNEYARGWRFKLEVAPNDRDLLLTVKQTSRR